LRGTICEVRSRIDEQNVKGEIALVVRGATDQPAVSEEGLIREIDTLARDGMRVKEIAEFVGGRHGIPKREVYRLALRRKNSK
jgi:16S rRNA (cytidine1402-2'-O)-methyltransferase